MKCCEKQNLSVCKSQKFSGDFNPLCVRNWLVKFWDGQKKKFFGNRPTSLFFNVAQCSKNGSPQLGQYFFEIAEGSRLMRISLLPISLLWFFKKIHKFALCEFIPYALGYFVSFVQFFWLFLPNFANANFFQNQNSN
jgi:hypothetical protein